MEDKMKKGIFGKIIKYRVILVFFIIDISAIIAMIFYSVYTLRLLYLKYKEIIIIKTKANEKRRKR